MNPIILVPTTAHRTQQRGYWQLSLKCPFCPATHYHGGGDSDEGPGLYGSRVPHCGTLFDRWGREIFTSGLTLHVDYDLRPAGEDVDWAAEYQRGNQLMTETVKAATSIPPKQRDVMLSAQRKNLATCLEHIKQFSK